MTDYTYSFDTTCTNPTLEKIENSLVTYEQEKYNSVGITNAKLAAVALYHLEEHEIERNWENLVVALQQLYPGKFSLITYPHIPDTIRIDNTLRLDAKVHGDFLTGNRPKGYRLTAKGRFVAEETIQLLQSSNTKQKTQKLDYQRQNRYVRMVSSITSSDCYEKFSTKQLSEISNFDVRRLLQCTLETPEKRVLANLDTLLNMTNALSRIDEYKELTSSVLELLNYIQNNWETLKND